MGTDTCILTCCGQTYCSAGNTQFNSTIVACVCTTSVCESECSTTGDFCNGGAPLGTTACNDCITQATGKGGPCATAEKDCDSNTDCSAFLSCASGCP